MKLEAYLNSNCKYILGFGCGVDSVALLLLLEDWGVDYEAVFVDTGAEWPETYEYLDMLLGMGYKIKVVKPNASGFDNLYDYCMHYKIFPLFTNRFCTVHFKIEPFNKYVRSIRTIKRKVVLMAIDYDEKYRRDRLLKRKENRNYKFPLVDLKITRDKCKRIISEHGLPIPIKSGCYFCPFQNVSRIRTLKYKHPDLFRKAIKLMENAGVSYDKWKYIGKSNQVSIDEYI